MLSARLIEPGLVEVGETDTPNGRGLAVVRMQTLGVCGTDSSIVAGKIPVDLPRVLGHEGIGVVEQPGPLGLVAAGTRVLIDPSISCEVCDLCRRGYPNLCRNGGLMGRDIDGLFANYAAVPERQLLVVPDDVSSDEAGAIQVLGTCVHAVKAAPIHPGDVAVVIGLGVAGQLIVQLLTASGARVIGVTRSQEKRDLAIRHGARSAVAPADAKEAVMEATSGRGAEVVVEAVGSQATFTQAIELAGAAATVVFFGTATGSSGGLPYYLLYINELTIRNPRAATKADYQRAIDLVADGTISCAPLVSCRFPLAEADKALEAARESSTLKVLITVD
jgi:L-iditol 2-dehydrogenase|tara:strand:- start:1435 stop:2436 length:1002 start_codon:yes stop_codon:yes gene_type:complete